MEFYIKDKLDQTEHKNILNFLSSLSYYCIEQHPDWAFEDRSSLDKFFYCTSDDQEVQCFANILISKNGPFKVAYIDFGPAFEDYEVLTKSIQFLHDYFSKSGFIHFSIQLGTYISEKTELLEYTINKNFKVKYYFKPGNLWSSLSVDLTRTEAEIFKSFSSAHKANIKASYKKGLRITIQKDNYDINSFIELYMKMYEFRKLVYDKSILVYSVTSIFAIMAKYDKGFCVSIFDKDILVGAFIVVFQGNVSRYFKSASDPERRDLSILHLGIFEAIKYCKEKGYLTFDLWGYNHFVDAKDQIFSINIFKKGFTDNFTFFPKRMNFELKPLVYKVFICLKFIRNGIKNFLVKRSIL